MRSRLALMVVGLLLVVAARAGTGPAPSTGGSAGSADWEAVAGSSTSSPSPSGPPTGTVEEARSFTLVAAGDVLLHAPLWEQAQLDAGQTGGEGLDFEPLLAGVKPIVEDADLSICHLETPLARAGGPYTGWPRFAVPPEIVPALASTGYDACTTASNHIYDQGTEGIDRTLDALDDAGIDHAGAARTPEEAAETTLLEVNGAIVALLSYTYGFNGLPAPNGETWRSNLIKKDRILADAATARAQGADVVIVALHWGEQHVHEPNSQQEALAPDLIRSPDIDLLLGHHAHIVQPVEAIDGEWVVYGMGNMVAHQAVPEDPTREEGLLVRFTFTDTAATGSTTWRVTDAEFTALLTARDVRPLRLVDVGQALTDPSLADASPERLQEAWDRTTGVVQQRGAADHGLHPIHPL